MKAVQSRRNDHIIQHDSCSWSRINAQISARFLLLVPNQRTYIRTPPLIQPHKRYTQLLHIRRNAALTTPHRSHRAKCQITRRKLQLHKALLPRFQFQTDLRRKTNRAPRQTHIHHHTPQRPRRQRTRNLHPPAAPIPLRTPPLHHCPALLLHAKSRTGA